MQLAPSQDASSKSYFWQEETGNMRKVLGTLLLAIVALAVGSPTANAGAIIWNSASNYLGVNDFGHLNFYGVAGDPFTSGTIDQTGAVGLATIFPDGTLRDGTSPGCLCEGWGASADGISGYASVDSGGVVNLGLVGFGTDYVPGAVVGSFATSTTAVGGTDLVVTQAYSVSGVAPVLFENMVTLSNVGAGAMADVRYTRAMDWDISPDEFNELVTIGGLPAANLLYSDNNGFEIPDPLGGRFSFGLANVNFVDAGPTDHGAVFDFGFGGLAAGESKSFKIYYGVTETEAAAFAALAAVGAEVYSFGQYHGDPTGRTYIFAFKGVGGAPVVIPEPGTLILLGSGLVAVARRFRK
jgi:type IV pilus assembly protein PilY1